MVIKQISATEVTNFRSTISLQAYSEVKQFADQVRVIDLPAQMFVLRFYCFASVAPSRFTREQLEHSCSLLNYFVLLTVSFESATD